MTRLNDLCARYGAQITTEKVLKVSFSGGETSAYMLLWARDNLFHLYDKVYVIFCNTSQENDETLDFIKRVSDHWSIPVIWIEAKVNHKKNKGTGFFVTDYDNAKRSGEVFEEVIKKYGIPNPDFQPCNRELKIVPMDKFMAAQGYKKGDYDTLIGIRHDEIDRINEKHKELRLIYPLVSMNPMTKPMINEFWSKQPFRLKLKGYEGNCKWCWKKSLRKHLTIISEHPDWYDFPERMEKEYGFAGARKEGDSKPRVFFRQHRSVRDLRKMAADGFFTPAQDDAVIYPEPDLFGFDLDSSYGCSESCEPYH